MQSPAAARMILTNGLRSRPRYPLSAAAIPNIPRSAVMQIWTISNTLCTFTKSIAGLRAKTYGTTNAAIASFVATRPVFIGSDLAIAEPAYAARATGGSIRSNQRACFRS